MIRRQTVRSFVRTLILCFVFASVSPLVAVAQDAKPAAEAPTPDKKGVMPDKASDKPNVMGFKATDTVLKEELPAWPFLYGAYGFIWALMMAYVMFLWMSQRKLDQRIASLDKRLDELDRQLEALDDEAES